MLDCGVVWLVECIDECDECVVVYVLCDVVCVGLVGFEVGCVGECCDWDVGCYDGFCLFVW